MLFPFDLAKRVRTNTLNGTFTLNEALARLLDGTELAVVTDENGQVSIRSRNALAAKQVPKQALQEKQPEQEELFFSKTTS